MEAARRFSVFLLFVCWWRTSYTGSIKLCTDSPTSFVNGTAIPAMLGKPVSVVFCVQCDPRRYISKYIQIQHPNHATDGIYYYTHNKDVWRPIIVNITSSANKATINITIKTVKKEDFTDTFSVIINTNRGITDNLVVFFYLIAAAISDPSTSDATLIIRTQSKMPAATSIRTSPASSSTEMSTVSLQTRTISTSTQKISQCRPHKTSQCPENWHQVDNETCLLVTRVLDNALPRDVCMGHGSEPFKIKNFIKHRSCLMNILQQSETTAINYKVRLETNVYVDVQNEASTSSRSYNTYNVACVQKKENFKPPTVSLFTLEIHTKTGSSLVDNSTDYVTVNTTHSDVALTCEADGVPKPRVVITSESGNQFTSDTRIRLADCSPAQVYTCTASNFLGTAQAHRRIHMLSPLKVKFTANNNRRAEIRPGDIVELKCFIHGCPDKVTITRHEHPIAETANYTIPFVHEITGVNCSHMGTYTCLAKSPTGQDVQETADLEVKGCRSNSTVEQKSKGNEVESNILLIALPPTCSIIIVCIIAGIVWYRVKCHYENLSPGMSPNAEYVQVVAVPYESIILNTDGMEGLSHAEYVEIIDVQYETPVNCIDTNKITSRVHNSEAEYANTITNV